MSKEMNIHEDIIEFCRLIYGKDLISGGSGNVSARLDDNQIVITPSGCHKGRLCANDLLVYDILENKLKGKSTHKPSSEIRMHTFVYRNRSEINAVIHAHPPYAVALSVAGVSVADVVLPESILAVGPIVDCGYATPTTEEVVNAMEAAIQDGCNAVMLARHGSVTIGKTLDEAFNHLETLEHVAKVTTIAKSIGTVSRLPKREIDKLKRMRP